MFRNCEARHDSWRYSVGADPRRARCVRPRHSSSKPNVSSEPEIPPGAFCVGTKPPPWRRAEPGPPKEQREGLLPDELHSAKWQRMYRYAAHDHKKETHGWEDFQRGKMNRDRWLHLTYLDLVNRGGIVDDLILLVGWSQDWYQRDQPSIKEKWNIYKRPGMVSMPPREALRTNKQLFLTRFQEKPVQHRRFCRDPRKYEYTTGYVFVDAGDEVYFEVLKILEAHNPWQMDAMKKLSDTKKWFRKKLGSLKV